MILSARTMRNLHFYSEMSMYIDKVYNMQI